MKRKLTQRMVDAMPIPEKGETWLHDSEVTGLGVRARASGKKQYMLRYKAHGRDRKITIGNVGVARLEDARATAKQHRWSIATGNDPQEMRRRSKALRDLTVTDLAEETLQHLESQGATRDYIDNYRRLLRNTIGPAIGILGVTEVTTRDLDRVVRSLKDRPRTGNVCKSFFSRMFKLATRWGYRPDDPSLGVEKFKEQARERTLTDDELRRLLAALDASQAQQSADVVRLLLFTGSRPQELLAATWSMFDLDEGTWTKPSQHTKQKKLHRTELGPDALAILQRMDTERRPGQQWLFPSKDSASGHLTTIKTFWRLLCRRAGLEGIRPYDLRRTVLTRLMGSGADLRTVMDVSGHTQPSTLLRHYAQGMPGRQRAALEGLFSTTTKDDA